MNKNIDISKILTKGSTRQRALLYVNNIVEKIPVTAWPGCLLAGSRKGFLTELEERQVSASFKTGPEIKLYDRFLDVGIHIQNQLSVLIVLQLQYRETLARLAGFLLLFEAYGEFAKTLSGLYFSMETSEERKKVVEYLGKNKSYLLADIGPAQDPDKNGIWVSLGRETQDEPRKNPEGPKLIDLLQVLSKRAEKQLRECKTVLQAIRDKMEETGCTLTLHTKTLDEIEKDLKEVGTPFAKFNGKKTEKGLPEYADDPRQKQHMEEIFGSNWLFLDYEKIEIDQDLYEAVFKKLGKCE